MDDITKDDRFKHIPTDSRFRVMPRKDRKFKVDNRFKQMFHDKSFKLKYSVDKRGRPVNLTTNDNLKKFYELSSESEAEEKDISPKNTQSPESPSSSEEKKDDEDEEKDSDDEESSESEKESSEEESDDSSDESGVENDVEEIPWNEFDKDTKRGEEISSRLAMCNMDWDRIKATDLFVLLNSFKPTNGVIKSVKIYLSEYGAKRIAYEAIHGPQELTETSAKENIKISEKKLAGQAKEEDDLDDYNDAEEGDNFDRIKLRTYQFNRLKYYYAVVECDSDQTANKIYTECDGMEYESSCTRLDLRFIPEETEFTEEPKDSCLELPDPLTFKPNLFFTTALNQTKVECTWDETPRDRLAITMKKYTESELKNNNDFKHIIASESEQEDEEEVVEEVEEFKVPEIKKKENSKNKASKKQLKNNDEDDEESRLEKYRSLLLGTTEKEQNKREADLEFNWDGGIDDEENYSDDEDDILASSKKVAATKTSNKPNKKKSITEEEKNEEAQLSMLTMDNDDGKAHFNLDDLLIDNDKKKSKRKKKMLEEKNKNAKEDDFKLNVNDPRFEAIFVNHKFNIDPSDQLFKKTKAMEELVDAKNKRKIAEVDQKGQESDNDEKVNPKTARLDPSASLLVSSIKSKTEILERRKNEIKERQRKMKFKIKK